MVKIKPILLFLFLFIGFELSAQNINITASTDSTNYYVGDYINYKLEIVRDKNVRVELPAVQDSVSNLIFIKELPPKSYKSDSQVVDEYTYVFSKYDSADVIIPSYAVSFSVVGDNYRYSTNVNDVFIAINTLPVDSKAEIMDVKSPLEISFNWIFWGIIFLAVLILAVVGYYLYLYYKKKNAPEGTIKQVVYVPPYKAALKALFGLEEKQLWQKGEIKRYHSEVTEIIRRYFEDEFKVKALEMPSSELLEELKKVRRADEIFDLSRDFFSNADMVKFAKFQPMPSVNETMLKQAFEIVNSTKIEENAETAGEVTNV
ncbi:MAG: hypothetical protein JEY94_08180 [Melioribacteraceae bacterium]|nr:hypothetical protein [Melioribacteraceae bacterium]